MNENPEGAATGEEIARAAESVVEPTVGPLVEPVAIRFEKPKVAEPVSSETVAEPVAMKPQFVEPEPMPAEETPVVKPEPAPEPEPRIETMEVLKEEPPKKKTKGGLIAMLVLLVAAFAAALVALVIVNPFKSEDKVPAAISKLMSSETGDKIALEGTIAAISNYEDDYLQSLVADFSFGSDAKTTENFVNATVTATFADESEFEFETNEMHTKNGDLYLKLSGISNALNNYTPVTNENNAQSLNDIDTTNCLQNDDGALNCLVYEPYYDPTAGILESLGMFEALDDEWILIPDSSFNTITSMFDVDEPISCLVDVASDLETYGKDLAAKYNANQFITYSTDNLKIAKKKNDLYRLGLDDEKLAGFVNSMTNSGLANALIACTGGNATVNDVDAEEVAEITKHVPDFYVEIDDNNNITRIYTTIETDEANVTVDLAVIYPTSIDLEEPTLYLNLNDLMRSMLEQFYGEPIAEEAF